jgi:hypothetical protein
MSLHDGPGSSLLLEFSGLHTKQMRSKHTEFPPNIFNTHSLAQIVLIHIQTVLRWSSLIEITKQKPMKQLQVRLVGNGLSHVTPIWLKA